MNLATATLPTRRTRWAWIAAGWLCLATGVVGTVVPLLPTTDFVLLAAYCFSRGSERWERWLLNHPRFGPMVRDWRQHRVVPLRAKLMASLMMLASCALAWWWLPMRTAWIPSAVCTLVAAYLWSRPSAAPCPASAKRGSASLPARQVH